MGEMRLIGHSAFQTPRSCRNCCRGHWPSGALFHWEFAKRGRALTIDAPGMLTLDDPSLMRDAALADAGLSAFIKMLRP
jgi:hypothetical protein